MRILWYSQYTLFDSTNGAAIKTRLMLEGLARRGHAVTAVCGRHLDGGFCLTRATTIKQGTWYFREKGVRYVLCESSVLPPKDAFMTELAEVGQRAIELLNDSDVLMTYGADAVSDNVRLEACRRHVPVIYSLCNHLHHGWDFKHLTKLITSSHYTASMYSARDKVKPREIGQFIDIPAVKAVNRLPLYIDMVSTAPHKGYEWFRRLARAYKGPYRFRAIKTCDCAEDEYVKLVQPTENMAAFYAETAILLCPSIREESWGRAATEAMINRIPVLCSNNGGLPQAMNGCGAILPKPVSPSSKQYDVVLEMWLEAIHKYEREPVRGVCNYTEWVFENNLTALESLLHECCGHSTT